MAKKRHYYNSDLRLSQAFYRENNENQKISIDVPKHVKLEYFTSQMKGFITVEREGNNFINCGLSPDKKQLLVAIPLSHQDIGFGELLCVITEYQEDSLFPDKIKEVKTPIDTGILLWNGESEDKNIIINEQLLPAFQYGYSAYQLAVKYGYKGTEADFAAAWTPIDITKYLKIEDAKKEYTTLRDFEVLKSLSNSNLSECVNIKETLNTFIKKVASDFVNYYTKTEVYNQREIDSKVNDLQGKISSIPKFAIEVVNSLPEKGEQDKIYIIRGKGKDKDNFTEYIFVNGAPERLGSATLDLADYYNKSEVYSRQEIETHNKAISDRINEAFAKFPEIVASIQQTNSTIASVNKRVGEVDKKFGEYSKSAEIEKNYAKKNGDTVEPFSVLKLEFGEDLDYIDVNGDGFVFGNEEGQNILPRPIGLGVVALQGWVTEQQERISKTFAEQIRFLEESNRNLQRTVEEQGRKIEGLSGNLAHSNDEFYNKELQLVAYGFVHDNGAVEYYRTFDGSTLNIGRWETGKYFINLPTKWFYTANEIFPMITSTEQDHYHRYIGINGIAKGSDNLWHIDILGGRGSIIENSAFNFMIYRRKNR